MIDAITTLKQLAALKAAVKNASEAAMQHANTEDGGTSNFDTCYIRLCIPKRLRDKSQLHFYKGWGLFRDSWSIQELPAHGQGNMRTRMAEAAAKSLCAAGYNATVRYEID